MRGWLGWRIKRPSRRVIFAAAVFMGVASLSLLFILRRAEPEEPVREPAAVVGVGPGPVKGVSLQRVVWRRNDLPPDQLDRVGFVRGIDLTSTDLAAIASCPNLVQLDLFFSPLESASDFAPFREHKELRRLRFGKVSGENREAASDELGAVVSTLPNLAELELLDDSLPTLPDLFKLPKLTRLVSRGPAAFRVSTGLSQSLTDLDFSRGRVNWASAPTTIKDDEFWKMQWGRARKARVLRLNQMENMCDYLLETVAMHEDLREIQFSGGKSWPSDFSRGYYDPLRFVGLPAAKAIGSNPSVEVVVMNHRQHGGYVNFDRECFVELAKLPKLRVLKNRQSKGDPSIFNELGRMRSLEHLEFSTGIGPEVGAAEIAAIASLPRLSLLSLDGWSLQGPGCADAIGKASGLRGLSLIECNWGPKSFVPNDANFLVGLGQLSKLESLDLSSNYWLTDEHLIAIGHLPNLKYLNLRSCGKVTSKGIQALIGAGAQLEEINCGQLHSDGFADSLFALLAKCPRLKRLHLRGVWMDGPQRGAGIANLKGLEYLDVSGTEIPRMFPPPSPEGRITRSWLLNLRGLPIRILKLSSVDPLDETTARVIASLTVLEVLDLSHSWQMPVEVFHALAQSRSLRMMSLFGIEVLTVDALLALERAPVLEYVYLGESEHEYLKNFDQWQTRRRGRFHLNGFGEESIVRPRWSELPGWDYSVAPWPIGEW